MQRLKVGFYLKVEKLKDGKSAIYGKIKVGATSCTFCTGKYISKQRWEKTSCLRLADRIDNEVSVKEHLNFIASELDRIYNQQVRNQNGSITATDLKNIYYGVDTKQEITLVEVVNKHNQYFKMQVDKGDRASGSLEKYERMLEVLKEYLQYKYKKSDIQFDKIGTEFVFELDNYLRFKRRHGDKKGLGHNTTVKYIRNISCLFNYAVRHKHIKENPFKLYNQGLKDVDTVYLTEEELKTIENKTFETRRLEVTRDIFLFSCYTSYAPCDAMRLTWDNIESDSDSNLWIMTNRHKTKVTSNTIILPPVKRILDKYKDDPECCDGKRLLPRRANSNVNAYLKDVAKSCGITKNLTWYVSRHTFATTVALSNNMPLEVIANIMGHKRITQTQHYAKIKADSVKREMLMLAQKFK